MLFILAPNEVLSGKSSETKTIYFLVRNESNHTDTIGIYADIVPPGGTSNPYGCTPSGRILNTTATLNEGQYSIKSATVTFHCANKAGALGKTYTIMAAADAHADDLASCPVFGIGTLACGNALASDDDDASNNRLTRNCCKVQS